MMRVIMPAARRERRNVDTVYATRERRYGSLFQATRDVDGI